MMLTIALLCAFVVAWAITGLVREYSVRWSVLDIPNDRSMHSAATPRGGGLSVVMVMLAGIAVQTFRGQLPAAQGAALMAGGGLVALVGWADDHRHVPALWRALVHFIAAAGVVITIGTRDGFRVGTTLIELGPLAPIIAVLGMVWFINLFNFMDGIDGIAAGEALVVAATGGFMLTLAGNRGLAVLAFVLSAAAAGFLSWNWPPARIFMGDVGSGFLGFMLGSFALLSEANHDVPVSVWLIVTGVFVFDATVTLIRRIGREKLYLAHSHHAYQRAVKGGWSHRRVTATVMAINLGLAALAWFAWARPAAAWWIVLLAAATLTVLYRSVERRSPMWPSRVRTNEPRRVAR